MECGVYVYESCDGGFATHVASKRVMGPIPKVSPYDTVPPEQWIEESRYQYKWVHEAPRVPIGLPEDGKTFQDDTLEQLLDRLQMLRKWGYHIPENVFTCLQEDIINEQKYDTTT